LDSLTFIDRLVGQLAWPAALVAAVWLVRGPLLELARGRRPAAADPAAGSRERGAGPAEPVRQDGSDQTRIDQAAVLGAGLAAVIAVSLGPGSWGWWSTGVGVTLLALIVGFYSVPPRTEPPLRRARQLLALAAVAGFCATIALAYAWQTWGPYRGATSETNDEVVDIFCGNVAEAARVNQQNELDQTSSQTTVPPSATVPPSSTAPPPSTVSPQAREDAAQDAEIRAWDGCLALYGPRHLEVLGLILAVLIFVAAFARSSRKPGPASGGNGAAPAGAGPPAQASGAGPTRLD
jgi:hypothetical protein